jgi:putative transposase
MGDVEDYIGDVKRWHHSLQRHWWMTPALFEAEDGFRFEAEDGFRRLTGYDDLPRLKAALRETIPDEE